MAADLVVREWGWSVGGVSDELAEEHNALARAYAKQAVQLAARTAEREHWFERSQALIAQLEASEAVREAEGQK